jgi:dipeptidyl aminopeptidase/acylaminoacyl peptidase
LSVCAFAQGTLEDYKRASGLRAKMQPLMEGSAGPIRWIDKTNRFWYSRTTKDGNGYVVVDSTGTRAPAFDHARLAKVLTESQGRPYDSNRLQILGYDGKFVDLMLSDEQWRVDLANYELKKARERVYFGRGPRVPEADKPVPSPDGKHEVLIRNYNVWIREKGKAAAALSTDGSEGNYYALSEQAWSPDGKKIAVYRVRPGQRRVINAVESSPDSQVQPLLKSFSYAKPGDALDIPRAVLFDVATRKQFHVDPALYENPYALSRIEWRKDSRAFHFNYNQRGHQAYRVIEVDASNGAARAVIDERSDTFFCYYSKLYRHDVNDGREVIWMSERDGWNHLYLYDGATGRVKNQITKGEWVVRSVVAVDDAKREIYFLASGVDAGKDPYFKHFFKVRFDGGGLTRLTKLDADHTATVSPDFSHYTLTYSRVDLPPVTELRTFGGDSKVIESVALEPLRAAGWRAPEVFTSKARDGKTDIWGLIYRPSHFDAAKKYPVLEYIYAGPHDSFVPKTFSAAHNMQEMAELGFIVVQMDGMGTSNRSKAFHDVCWKNIGDAGFPDRILWHKAAASKYAWYDLERLGIYGHSAGGQNSLGAMLRYPDFYKAAASSAGCHDNRMDKISWNEQWMSWPVGPEYEASSNVTLAKNLKGKLFLAVGELDTNVDPASTMQVVNALIKARKVFDLLVVPGADHGLGAYWEQRRKDFFVRTLLGVEPPNWNVVAQEEAVRRSN